MYINCVDFNEMLFLGGACERVCSHALIHTNTTECPLCAVYFVIEFESLTLQHKLCIGSYVRLFTCLACIFCPNGFSSQSQRKRNEYGRMTSTDLRIYNICIF